MPLKKEPEPKLIKNYGISIPLENVLLVVLFYLAVNKLIADDTIHFY